MGKKLYILGMFEYYEWWVKIWLRLHNKQISYLCFNVSGQMDFGAPKYAI